MSTKGAIHFPHSSQRFVSLEAPSRGLAIGQELQQSLPPGGHPFLAPQVLSQCHAGKCLPVGSVWGALIWSFCWFLLGKKNSLQGLSSCKCAVPEHRDGERGPLWVLVAPLPVSQKVTQLLSTPTQWINLHTSLLHSQLSSYYFYLCEPSGHQLCLIVQTPGERRSDWISHSPARRESSPWLELSARLNCISNAIRSDYVHGWCLLPRQRVCSGRHKNILEGDGLIQQAP